jgi:hypothetical protein
LGDPLKRLQSHTLQFVKNACHENKVTDVASVLKAGHKALDNYYTRLISGMDAPFGECTEQMLDTAIANLGKFFIFIGINERQAQSFDRLCILMDWDRSLFPEEIPNSYEINPSDFSEDNLQWMNDLIQFDLRLYNAALALIKSDHS